MPQLRHSLDLDGDAGRAVRLYAECKNFNGNYVQTNLDLNTCFGWADCEFAPYDKYDFRDLALDPPPKGALNLPGSPKGARITRAHELMAVFSRDFSQTCTACDNPWEYEDQFGREFSESCDLSQQWTMLMPAPACIGYCENKDENGKQQNVASIDLGECTPAWLGKPLTNTSSNRRVHRQQQRQPLLFAGNVRAPLFFET